MTDITDRLRHGPVTPTLADEAAHIISDLRAVILTLLDPPPQARSYTIPVPKTREVEVAGWDFYHTGNLKTAEIRLKLERK